MNDVDVLSLAVKAHHAGYDTPESVVEYLRGLIVRTQEHLQDRAAKRYHTPPQ